MEVLLTTSKQVLKLFFFILTCICGPFNAFRLLKKPERCPPITNQNLFLSASELARKIRRRELTSEEVISAYVSRCREVNPVLNAIVQDRFEAALKEAREIDKLLETGDQSLEEIEEKTPLLGVPFTVKESIGVEGMSNAAGVKRPIKRIAVEDADVVRRTRLAGGIPLLVSNTPELCMFWETYNNVTGTTKNPYDTRRTPGGSSGGESALLGAGASVLSLASDVAGSCRLPAMYCGVFGHKPSPGLISVSGHVPKCQDENWPLYFAIGPMVRYTEDLPLFLKVLSQDQEMAEAILSKKVDLRQMRYFYLDDNSLSSCTNSISRDIKITMFKLFEHLEKTYGVRIEKIHVEDLKYSFESSSCLLLRIEGVETIFMKGTDPREWKSVFLELMKKIFCMSHHTFHAIFYGILNKTVSILPESYKMMMTEKNNNAKLKLEEILGDNGVLIHPTFPTAAIQPYEIFMKICDVTYMMIFNSFGFPVTQCTMGFNDKGLPIGLQVAARPQCDHLTIAVAQEIERVFGGWKPPENSQQVS